MNNHGRVAGIPVRFFYPISIGLLLLSVVYLWLLTYADELLSIPFQWWIHIAIMFALGGGIFEMRHLRIDSRSALAVLGGFSWRMGILGLFVLLATAPCVPFDAFSFGTTPFGEKIHSEHWFTESGRFFLEINKKYVHEITQHQYIELNRQLDRVFSVFWIALSYSAAILWNGIRQQGRNPSDRGQSPTY